jgi:transcriptional regulator with XRE-family HTH domain
MIPAGRTIEQWRRSKGMSQAELAGRSGIPRPNLSIIEQGGRDLTLSTLRRIADALGITPGTIADGVLPLALGRAVWTREQLDKIARAAAGRPAKLSGEEEKALQAVKELLKHSSGGKTPFKLPRRGKKREHAALDLARQYFNETEFNNLLGRIRKWEQTRS